MRGLGGSRVRIRTAETRWAAWWKNNVQKTMFRKTMFSLVGTPT